LPLETNVLFASELLSTCLASLIVYGMLKSYRVNRSKHLLGFPIGFSFLAISYVLLGVSYVFSSPNLSSLLLPASWAHILLQSFGFAFLAGTYLFAESSGVSGTLGRVWLFSILVVLAGTTLLVLVIPPYLSLPSYDVADEIFRALNIVLLVYIVAAVSQTLRTAPLEYSRMVLGGFIFIAIGQYSQLLWALDSGFWAFALAHVLRLLGLVALALVMLRRYEET
jgi:uncharacterized membrane protein